MTHRVLGFLLALTMSFAWSNICEADDPICVEIKQAVTNKVFVAKEPLYDTVVDNEGIVKLERDKEEIPAGARFKVLKVECEGGKLEIKLRQVAAKKLEAVDIVFRLTKAERQMPDAMDQFQEIANFVWEEVPEEQ